LDALIDPETRHAKVRAVDVAGESFRIAQDYMIRLTAADLADPGRVDELAKAAKMTAEEFRVRFAALA
jgi:hypothetical protein